MSWDDGKRHSPCLRTTDDVMRCPRNERGHFSMRRRSRSHGGLTVWMAWSVDWARPAPGAIVSIVTEAEAGF